MLKVVEALPATSYVGGYLCTPPPKAVLRAATLVIISLPLSVVLAVDWSYPDASAKGCRSRAHVLSLITVYLYKEPPESG